jgi:single-strand DNA-binding protein
MNTISITGRLAKDAELRYTNTNKPVLGFTVASDIGYGDKKKTNFFDCQLWGDRAEKVAQYMTKGQAVTVIGEVGIRQYEKKDGTKATAVDVNVDKFEFQGSKADKEKDKPTQTPPAPPKSQQTYAGASGSEPPIDDFDDDIPFN